ncbi:hypothetical protein AURDEDRAFT_166382 [Auricularia subglabra TFB-10046 SS5]|uniref:Uncharacterized protein n=1 Tax=Auricularia subglabra (strain TFB-10046 / SS5) TaxID=717982 RepID=J0WZ67_AURST|nr:hypothetical protein AURDEDRAFT_166382 [Auricularia subglabra TFB-10046 SS5]
MATDTCRILDLGKEEWGAVLDELYLATLSELPAFGHESDEWHPPGRYLYEALDALSRTCKVARAMCLERVYAYVHLMPTQTVFSMATQFNRGFYYRAAGLLSRSNRLLKAEPFARTTSLQIHVSPLSMLGEHFQALAQELHALRHVYVRVLFRESEAQDATEYTTALTHINSFLRTPTGQGLISVGFWFVKGDGIYAAASAMEHEAASWGPLCVGPNTTKVLFFPGICQAEGGRPGALIRFLPWPCAVREVVMGAADFCRTDAMTWYGQTEVGKVWLRQTDGDAFSLGDALLVASVGWGGRLRSLRIDGTTFDARCAQALAQLRGLDELDLHPDFVDATGAAQLYDLDDDNLREANDRLEHADQSEELAGHQRHRIVLVADRAELANRAQFAQVDEETAGQMVSLLRLCLPALKVRIVHLGATAHCVLEDRESMEDCWGGATSEHTAYDVYDREQRCASDVIGAAREHISSASEAATEGSDGCEIWRLVIESTDGDKSDEGRVARALARVSHRLWAMTMPFAVLRLVVYGQQAAILKYYMGLAMPLISAYEYTRDLCVACDVGEAGELALAAAGCLPSLRSLSIICGGVAFRRSQREWDVVPGQLSRLAQLREICSLRHLGIYLLVQHTYDRSVALALDKLDRLACLTQLHSISFRISGGLQLTADPDIDIPRGARRIRLSAEVLALVNRGSWLLGDVLAVVEVEDLRHNEQLAHRSVFHAARSLTSGIAAALPGWTRHLRTLQLLSVCLNYGAIVLVAELKQLGRLDLIPRRVDMAWMEKELLSEQAIKTGNRELSTEEVEVSGIGPFIGGLLLCGGAPDLLDGLKYLLGRMPHLRVLVIGDASQPSVLGTAMEAQEEHIQLFTKLASHVLPSLALWGVGDSEGRVEHLLHMPSCGGCSRLGRGWRTERCLAMENGVALRDLGEHEMSRAEIAEKDARLDRVVSVGPVL